MMTLLKLDELCKGDLTYSKSATNMDTIGVFTVSPANCLNSLHMSEYTLSSPSGFLSSKSLQQCIALVSNAEISTTPLYKRELKWDTLLCKMRFCLWEYECVWVSTQCACWATLAAFVTVSVKPINKILAGCRMGDMMTFLYCQLCL